MKRRKYSEKDLPAPGSVFLVPLADGRYGAIRVLRSQVDFKGNASVYVVASSWIGHSATRPSDSELRDPLLLTHHACKGQPEAVWVGEPPPDSYIPAASLAPSPEDEAIASEAYGGWALPRQILLQWRWDHDRENLLAEEAAKEAREAEERRLRAEKHDEMLRTLTLDNVATRPWLSSWDEELDGPWLAPSKAILSEFIRDLAATPKLTRAAARKLLKAAVEKFNDLDTRHHFIETTHREDICDALEMILYAARHPNLATQIDQWRDW